MDLFPRFQHTVRLSGTPRSSRMTQSLNPNVMSKANGNTDLARTVVVGRKARARNDRIAIRNWVIIPPRRGKRAADRNARIATLMASPNENGENPKPVATKVRTKRRKIRQRDGRSGSLGRGRKNRKVEINQRTNPLPLPPTPVQNLTSSSGGDVQKRLRQNRNPKRTPRDLPSGHPPPRPSRNTMMRT